MSAMYRGLFSVQQFFILHRAFHRGLSREIRAQSDTFLHREYNLAKKNKSLRHIRLTISPDAFVTFLP